MTVYLVGAGPGDPGLLTRRGAELLGRADVVVYDRLVAPELLALAPPGAVLVDVGKRPGQPARQHDINAVLVEHGRAGRVVVRLKGGDPYLFGRGGEEAEALAAAGLAVEVVPGVSSALAVPAYAGVPVTHRGLSTSVTVVTGHVGDPSAPGGVDWESLGRAGGTLVVLMGMAERAEIARRLLAAGRAATTPVLVVQWGTTPRQRSVRTTLGSLADVELGAPATIVVGPVAGLELAGAPRRPLHGVTVAVTRPEGRAGSLAAALAAAGAAVVTVPLVVPADPADGGAALERAVAHLGDYDWVLFTSVTGVDRLLARLRDGRDLAGRRLAAVGSATARALADRYLTADVVAATARAEGLVEALVAAAPAGARALYPRAATARPVLADGLRAAGWTVDDVEAYQTVPVGPAPGDVDRLLGADLALVASPSAAEALVALAAGRGCPPVVCIGPVTAEAASHLGLAVAATAARPDPDALVNATVAGWAASHPA